MAKTISMLTTPRVRTGKVLSPAGGTLRDLACCQMIFSTCRAQAVRGANLLTCSGLIRLLKMDRKIGDAIADKLNRPRRAGQKLALILPVGPNGQCTKRSWIASALGHFFAQITYDYLLIWMNVGGATKRDTMPAICRGI